MAVIIRIDVDRPYGKHPLHRHLLSRLSSDFYLPKIQTLGFLEELEWMLGILNENRARSHIFFRRCTLPSSKVLALIQEGGHEIGLHLEDSRSFSSFCQERQTLERHIGRPVLTFSKHGSGGGKFGRRHYAPYEPEKYIHWAHQAGMKLFLGNLEDPTIPPAMADSGLAFFPAAFWLEPHWRDTSKFTMKWLADKTRDLDIVVLVHPENIRESRELTANFRKLAGEFRVKTLA